MTPPAPHADEFRRAPRRLAAPPDSIGLPVVARQMLAEDSGATMVEYGMMVALIAILVMGALYMLGGSISVKLNAVATCLTTRSC